MTDCAAPRHADAAELPEAAPHAQLCAPCRLGLRRDLRRLPGLDAVLGEFSVQRPSEPGNGDGLPFSEASLECRSDIRRHLAQAVRAVTADREGVPWEFGDGPRPVPCGETVAAMAGLVCGSMKWLPFRDWCGWLAGTLDKDARRAYSLLIAYRVVQFTIPLPRGACIECGEGRLQATLYTSEQDKRSSYVNCDRCGRQWWPINWRHMGERILKREALAG